MTRISSVARVCQRQLGFLVQCRSRSYTGVGCCSSYVADSVTHSNGLVVMRLQTDQLSIFVFVFVAKLVTESVTIRS